MKEEAAAGGTPARRSEVELLLLETGQELGRSAADMQPIIQKIVVDNWLDTSASLRRLSPEQWRLLQLPLGLEELLQMKLGLRHNSEAVAADRSSTMGRSKDSRFSFSDRETRHPSQEGAATAGPASDEGGSSSSSSTRASPADFSSSQQQQQRRLRQQQHQYQQHDSRTGGCGPRGGKAGAPARNSSNSNSAAAADNSCGAVEYEAVDERLFPIHLHDAVEQLQIGIPSEHLPTVLKTLFQVIHGVLAQPTNMKRRRLRKANPTFHRQLGQFPAAVRMMEAVGFAAKRLPAAEDACSSSSGAGPFEEPPVEEEFYVMDTAYIFRLTDCHHLLAELATHLKMPAPPLPEAAFNPYKASIISAAGPSLRQVAGKHVEQRMAEASLLQERIRSREKLLQTGGGEPVPLAPAVYSVEQLQREAALSEQQQQQQDWMGGEEATAEGSSKGGLTAADIARIKEVMGEGPQFKSRVKQELEKLQRRRLYKSCTVRVLLPNRSVLQLCFAPGDTLRHVQEQVRQFLHPALQHSPTEGNSRPASSSSSTGGSSSSSVPGREAAWSWFLCETPPLRKVDLKKTLYEEGFVPTCTLHLKLQAGCPPFPYPYLNAETLNKYGLTLPAVTAASTCRHSVQQQQESVGGGSSDTRSMGSGVQGTGAAEVLGASAAGSNSHYGAAPAASAESAAVGGRAEPPTGEASLPSSPAACASSSPGHFGSRGNPGSSNSSHGQNVSSSSRSGVHNNRNSSSCSSSSFVKHLLSGGKKK